MNSRSQGSGKAIGHVEETLMHGSPKTKREARERIQEAEGGEGTGRSPYTRQACRGSSPLSWRGAILPVAILAVTVALAVTVLYTDYAYTQQWRQQIHSEMSVRMTSTLGHVDEHFDRVYSLLSYVSFDPDVRAMRNEAPAHIQAVFDNQSSGHRLSELYVIARGVDGTHRPAMTFETGSDHLDVDELHSAERELDEYQTQIAQLRQFEEQPALHALISREIPLCLVQPDGTQASGLVYSVPVRSGGELVGIVAGMVPTRMIAEELERGNFANMAVLVSERGDLYSCEDLPADTQAWFENRIRQNGASALFADSSEGLRVGTWTAIRSPCRIVDGQRWWLVFLYDENTLRGRGSLQGLLAGRVSVAGILMFGFALTLLVLTMRRRILERETSLAEQTRMQRVLLASERRYKTLFDSSRDAIMTLEPPSWRFTSGNPATVSMFGAASEQDFTTHEPWTLSPERQSDGRASADGAKEMIETTMRDGSHFFEWTHTRIGGEAFPATVLLTRMEIEGKTFMQATVRDITVQKRAEEELSQERKLSEAIFNHMPDLSYLITEEGRFLRWNQKFETLSGYSAEEIARMHPLDFFPDEQKELVAAQIGQVFTTGRGEIAADFLTKQGKRLPFNFTGGIVTVDNVRCLAGTAQDVTEQKQAENSLRRSKEFSELILNSMHDAISIIDVRDFSIVGVNKTFLDQLGLTQAEVIGKTCYGVTHHLVRPCAPPEAPCPIDEILKTGQPATFEHKHFGKDGEPRYVEVTGSPIRNDEGEVIQIVHVAKDITERKRNEGERRELEKKVQERQKLAAVGTLACGMGHEINNPIMGIINYAQLIKDRLQGKDEALEEFAGEIVVEAERIAGIVRGLSAFATRDVATRAAVPVTDLIESALAPLRDALTHDRIALEVDLPDNLPAVVCDRGQIAQVLTSLLANARDALNERYPGHDENKIIVVSAELFERGTGNAERGSEETVPPSDIPRSDFRVPTSGGSELRLPTSDRWLRLTVEDHGTGIPLEVREHLFEPFFTTKDKSVGAGSIGKGLGLFVSHATMQEHGGALSVESPSTALRAGEPSQWTRFYLDLPVMPVQDAVAYQAVGKESEAV